MPTIAELGRALGIDTSVGSGPDLVPPPTDARADLQAAYSRANKDMQDFAASRGAGPNAVISAEQRGRIRDWTASEFSHVTIGGAFNLPLVALMANSPNFPAQIKWNSSHAVITQMAFPDKHLCILSGVWNFGSAGPTVAGIRDQGGVLHQPSSEEVMQRAHDYCRLLYGSPQLKNFDGTPVEMTWRGLVDHGAFLIEVVDFIRPRWGVENPYQLTPGPWTSALGLNYPEHLALAWFQIMSEIGPDYQPTFLINGVGMERFGDQSKNSIEGLKQLADRMLTYLVQNGISEARAKATLRFGDELHIFPTSPHLKPGGPNSDAIPIIDLKQYEAWWTWLKSMDLKGQIRECEWCDTYVNDSDPAKRWRVQAEIVRPIFEIAVKSRQCDLIEFAGPADLGSYKLTAERGRNYDPAKHLPRHPGDVGGFPLGFDLQPTPVFEAIKDVLAKAARS